MCQDRILTAVYQASYARASLWPPPHVVLIQNTALKSYGTSGCGAGLPPRGVVAPLYRASCGPSCFLHLASDGWVISVGGQKRLAYGHLLWLFETKDAICRVHLSDFNVIINCTSGVNGLSNLNVTKQNLDVRALSRPCTCLARVWVPASC